MSTAIRVSGRTTPNSRRVPRCALSVPVRVIMRNASGTQGIPGRSLDLGEGGIAAMLAGAVKTGDSVSVEFLLPEMGLGLHTRAVVRHQADLRCGLEFFGLSLEQQAMIRRWTRRMLEKPAAPTTQTAPTTASEPTPAAVGIQAEPETAPAPAPQPRRSSHRKWVGRMVAVFVIAMIGATLAEWRYWHTQWVELQQQADAVAALSAQRVKLTPGAIDLLVTHKVDAALPQGDASKAEIVPLQIVIGTDGTVIEAHPAGATEDLNRAAMEAVQEWRFQPYRVGGSAVEVESTVNVEFH